MRTLEPFSGNPDAYELGKERLVLPEQLCVAGTYIFMCRVSSDLNRQGFVVTKERIIKNIPDPGAEMLAVNGMVRPLQGRPRLITSITEFSNGELSEPADITVDHQGLVLPPGPEGSLLGGYFMAYFDEIDTEATVLAEMAGFDKEVAGLLRPVAD